MYLFLWPYAFSVLTRRDHWSETEHPGCHLHRLWSPFRIGASLLAEATIKIITWRNVFLRSCLLVDTAMHVLLQDSIQGGMQARYPDFYGPLEMSRLLVFVVRVELVHLSLREDNSPLLFPCETVLGGWRRTIRFKPLAMAPMTQEHCASPRVLHGHGATACMQLSRTRFFAISSEGFSL